MTLKLYPHQERAVRQIVGSQEIVRVETGLGKAGVICGRCGATLETYNDQCTAALDDPCPGFLAIEEASRS
jgi:hypothetical protein